MTDLCGIQGIEALPVKPSAEIQTNLGVLELAQDNVSVGSGISDHPEMGNVASVGAYEIDEIRRAHVGWDGQNGHQTSQRILLG